MQRYRFQQEKKVNHLLYVDYLKLYKKRKSDLVALTNTVRIFTDDIKMKFGISKRATSVMKRGMPGGIGVEDLGDEAYNYFDILESNKIKIE